MNKEINAEVICVGTEIIIGDIIDTHSQTISQALVAHGINVFYHSSVGDNEKRLCDTIKRALDRSNFIVLAGGLGPTADDMTKECVAKVLDLPLELNEDVLSQITLFFEKIGSPMTDNNKKQALIPKGARAIQNNNGTAPGVLIEKDEKTIVILPGPPRELMPMLNEFLTPYLEEICGEVIHSNVLRIMKVGESKVETMLEAFMNNKNPTVALYAKGFECIARVTSKAQNIDEAKKLNGQMIEKIKCVLGDNIYGIDVDSLHQVVVLKLIEKGKKVATAESCSGGLVSQMLTEISGSSQVFELGVCAYANHIKTQVLGVSAEDLQQQGAVSRTVAVQMAEGVKALAKADYGIGITGVAGPLGGTDKTPVGTVYIALALEGKTLVEKLDLSRNRNDQRDQIRQLSARQAFIMLLDQLDD